MSTQPVAESELAAAAVGLLAQPALWPSLVLAKPSVEGAASAPWSAYWAVRLDGGIAPAQAREVYAAALAAFDARGDAVGALLAIAAAIESFYVEEGALDPLDDWIAALLDRLPADGGWPSADLEAAVMACGIGVILRDQRHPLLQRWAERGAELVRHLRPGPGRLRLATFLVQYHLWRGEFARTAVIVDAMPGLQTTGLLPAEAIAWLESVATHARFSAELARGSEAVAAGLRLAAEHGLHQHVYALHAHGAALALAAQDAKAAAAHLDAMRPVLDQASQADQTHYWHFHAGLALLRGDVARAVELARATLANSAEIGGAYREALHHLSLGQTLFAAARHEEALASLQRSQQIAESIAAGMVGFTAMLMQSACLSALDHRADARTLLRGALAEGAGRDYRTTAAWWQPQVIARLAHDAIAEEIEPAYVCRLVRLHDLPGDDPALERWPWRLRLYAFGPFDARLDEAPLAAGGKTAQRPLDLLRVVLANAGAPLPVATALQWLWPEADPAAQRKAFDVALLRLRRLLGDAGWLRLEGGRLSLDGRWVWSDVGALHALMHRIGSAHGAHLQALQRWGWELLHLMRGPFLADEDADWAQAARERYRQRFVVTVAQLAGHIEPLHPPSAIELYQRALDIEPLAESLTRRLMRLHAARGDTAEALRAWRTSCTMLAVGGGLPPSRETRALAAELGFTAGR